MSKIAGSCNIKKYDSNNARRNPLDFPSFGSDVIFLAVLLVKVLLLKLLWIGGLYMRAKGADSNISPASTKKVSARPKLVLTLSIIGANVIWPKLQPATAIPVASPRFLKKSI